MRGRWTLLAVVFALVAAACTSSNSPSASGSNSGTSGAPVQLTMWMGYTPPPPVNESQEYLTIIDQVHRFEAANPNIKIEVQYVNSDVSLTRLKVALTGGKQPDITYQYGTNMAQVAQAPNVVDLTDKVQEPGFNWDDFFEGERGMATVNDRVYGVPALVDNLAVVYNKDLLAKAGVPEPKSDWTWDDFRAAAQATTDTPNQVWGTVFPADASETMVWQYEAMLWEAGGDILNADNTQAVFNSDAGVRAATMLQSINQDGSMYLDYHPDSGRSSTLFNSGKIGMIITGPWDLSAYPDVNYGVVQMPSFDPGGAHTTIAGPDNWVIFDNGADRVNASWEFIKFMTTPDNILKEDLATSHLPTRASVEQMPQFQQFYTKYPGVGDFVTNLKNVTKARPQIPQYPDVSTFLGQALVSVLLGQKSPQDALNEAADQSNAVLAIPT